MTLPGVLMVQSLVVPKVPVPEGELFQQMLGGFLEQEAKPQMETEKPEQEQPEVMDEVMAEAVHQFLRMPVQVPEEPILKFNESLMLVGKAIEVSEQPAVSEQYLRMPDRLPEKETLTSDETSWVEEQPLKVLDQTQQTIPQEVEIAQSDVTEQETKPYERTIAQTVDIKKVFNQSEPPITDKKMVETTAIVQSQAPIALENIPPAPKVTEQVTLQWHEPEQAIRELGETMKVSIERLPSQETQVVRVTLSPETFGEMDIQLTWEGDKVEATILVEKEEVKQQIMDRLDVLKEHLPKNPIVQTITIAVKPPVVLFQAPQQESQQRKQPQSKARYARGKEMEGESETAEIKPSRGLSLYI